MKTMRRTMHLLTATLLLVVVALAGPKHKISKDLRDKAPGEQVDVIVQFKPQPRQKHFKRVRRKGGKEKRKLSVVRGGSFSIAARELAALAADPDIEFISEDREVTASLDYATPTVLANIAQEYGWDGEGIGIAVIDSGIQSKHKDLKDKGPRIVYKESFVVNPDGTLDTANDKYGHGSHVAGIAAGNGARSNETYLGIAPKAALINLRVLDRNGKGTDSAVIAAIGRAIELKDQYNIRVINLSLGRPVYESYETDPLCQAAEAAWNAGIVVVVAAGNLGRDDSFDNDGYGTITAPGNDPYVITVGAMKTNATASRADDLIASYSSKGPTLVDHVVKPDLVAPGNRVVSLDGEKNSELADSFPENEVGSYYFKLSGTSMATPMVSGTVALILQQNPNLTPDQVKARLMKTASKTFPMTSTATDPLTGASFNSQYDIFTIGAGYLDVWAALSNNDVATALATSPTAVYDPQTGTVSVVFGNSVVWGTGVVWGTSVVWGTQVFVDGMSVIWGTGMPQGTSVVWGTDSPWGNSVIWGTTNEVQAMSVLVDGEE